MAQRKKRIVTGLKINPDTDKAEIKFNKKATDAEIKKYIKENFDNVNRDALPKEYSAYYGKVLGGKNKAAKAVRIEGKFVSNEFIDNTDFKGVAKAAGYKDVNELFNKDREIYEAAKNLYNSDFGVPVKYGAEETIYKISNFKGSIFINGKEYTKAKAIKRLDDFDKQLKRSQDIYYTEFWATYKKGGGEIHFTLPSIERVKDMDLEELLEFAENLEDRSFEVIESGRPAKEESQRDEIPEDKKDRYTYNYVILWKGRKKKGQVVDYNIDFARSQVKSMFKNCQILSLHRAK